MPTVVAFHEWRVEADPALTARVVSQREALDRTHCNLCAVWMAAVERQLVPATVLEFLAHVGVDTSRPVELWGAPDGGFLGGWFDFAGHLTDGAWAGGSSGAYAEPAPGFVCWVTGTPSMQPSPEYADSPVAQFEFEWTSNDVTQLESEVWNQEHTRGV